MNIRLHPEASNEMRESALYYEDRASGLGDKFLAEVEKSFSIIKENPYLWPADEKERRKCQVKRFPFQLVYRIHHRTIYILAVAHTKRTPGYWKNRDFL